MRYVLLYGDMQMHCSIAFRDLPLIAAPTHLSIITGGQFTFSLSHANEGERTDA